MMNKLICIIGASGTGKTSLADALCTQYIRKQVASATDRPKRDNETDGHGHVFVHPSWFDQHRDELVAYTVFDGHQYGVTAFMLDLCDVYVLDIPGIVELKKRYEREIFVIGLSAPENIRAQRMAKRGDSPENIRSRLEHDREAFPEEELRAVCDIVLDATAPVRGVSRSFPFDTLARTAFWAHNVQDKEYPVVELFGKKVIDMKCRMTSMMRDVSSEMIGHMFFYDIRHDDECQGDWVQIQPFVLVNHMTSICSKEPIDCPREIDEDDWGYTGEYMTLAEYYKEK